VGGGAMRATSLQQLSCHPKRKKSRELSVLVGRQENGQAKKSSGGRKKRKGKIRSRLLKIRLIPKERAARPFSGNGGENVHEKGRSNCSSFEPYLLGKKNCAFATKAAIKGGEEEKRRNEKNPIFAAREKKRPGASIAFQGEKEASA